MDKTNIALMGCGYWGKNHLRTLRAMKDVFISYVCDAKIKPANLELGNSAFTEDYRDVIKDPSVNGVIVCTPTATHYKLAKEMLEAGIPVFVEKPITTQSSEAQELIEIAGKNNLELMVGEIFRFNPAVAYIKSLADNGELGELRYLESRRVGLGPVRTDVSALWDLATHDIYISNLIVGKNPSSVSCTGVSHNGKLDDIACLNLRYENPNVLSTIYVNWEHPRKERMLIVGGAKKAVSFNDVEPSDKIAIFERAVDYLPASGDFGEFQSAIKSGNTIIPQLKLKQPLEEELRNFVDSLTGKAKCLSTGENGLQTVRVLEAAEESRNKNGLEIKLK